MASPGEHFNQPSPSARNSREYQSTGHPITNSGQRMSHDGFMQLHDESHGSILTTVRSTVTTETENKDEEDGNLHAHAMLFIIFIFCDS